MPKTALTRAMDYLAARPLSESELRKKLTDASYPEEESDSAIARCRELGFLNDELLAGDTAQYLNSIGKGRNLVRKKLISRGLDSETVERAMEAIADDEESAGRIALEGKLRSLVREKDPRKKREKAFRFMMSRGFSPGMTFALLEKMLPEYEPES